MPAPGQEIGAANRERVRQWFATHLCGTQRECAKALGLSDMAVCRHVAEIRAEWRHELEANVSRRGPKLTTGRYSSRVELVEAVLADWKRTARTKVQIARAHGVSIYTVTRIVNGVTGERAA